MALKHVERAKGCWANALEDERVFVLLARDATVPFVVLFWCLLRIVCFKNRSSDPQITEAVDCAFRMMRERKLVRRVIQARKLPVATHAREMNEALRELRATVERQA
ncbi:MAG TPA: hypothetical protein VHC90_20440 [Bryobacteraceae bacterium]|nr:hypothetical protein [Bryobacteraceae bacterium]